MHHHFLIGKADAVNEPEHVLVREVHSMFRATLMDHEKGWIYEKDSLLLIVMWIDKVFLLVV
jgi:hypothetical protein